MVLDMKGSLSLVMKSLDGADRLLTTSCQEPVIARRRKARAAPGSGRGLGAGEAVS
jgi:hypothetical protein